MRRLCLFLIVSLVAPVVADDPPMPFTGKVVKVTDGDTIHVLLDKEPHKIRLLHIDAPESKQAFGTKAKQALSDKIFGKEVKVVWKERDRYKRVLCDIYLGDRWINLEMVSDGLAWHYKHNSKDAKMAAAEVEARDARKGLWSDPSSVLGGRKVPRHESLAQPGLLPSASALSSGHSSGAMV
jgi:endonuclease YncB( thermonuclease family)